MGGFLIVVQNWSQGNQKVPTSTKTIDTVENNDFAEKYFAKFLKKT